jgi:cytosine/adenosine deaminase-related metal-dependent hydrolase
VANLFFDSALLPEGWASGVRVMMAGGAIAAVETDAAAQSGDERASIGLPGMATVHSHAFQRGMA